LCFLAQATCADGARLMDASVRPTAPIARVLASSRPPANRDREASAGHPRRRCTPDENLPFSVGSDTRSDSTFKLDDLKHDKPH
jgi:hypothetical protein